MASLSPSPKMQFFTANGVPLAGGKLYTYVAGGLTVPQTTYTDSTGGTPNTNPIILDSRGEANVWLTDGLLYAFKLTDSLDSLIWTADNISGELTPASIHAVASKTTPIDADEIPLVDSAASFVLKKLTWANLKATLFSSFGALIASGTPKNTPVDADSFAYMDSASANATKVISWLNIKTALFATSPLVNEFRLTLTTATPVTTADVIGATSIFCTPYIGNRIALYNGTNWITRTSAEFSLALGTLTAALPYDVFCFDNAGTPTLEFLAWTNTTTRATALAYQDGVLVKSGAATRRYLGTFYTTSTTQTEDSAANRYLWNYYNRSNRAMHVYDTTASWTYTTATWRQARATATNQLNFIVGVSEDCVTANVLSTISNSTAGVYAQVSIGFDSTTSPATNARQKFGSSGGAGYYTGLDSTYVDIPTIGKHSLIWIELSQAAGTTTWYGTATGIVSGIAGSILA